MRTICDTHILLFWAHEPARLSPRAAEALEQGRAQGQLAIADISLWELALLHERDPADRLIGATALQAQGPLITADVKLRAIPELETLW
jgi:PIN domain nuclease of toxin-antitoxin system